MSFRIFDDRSPHKRVPAKVVDAWYDRICADMKVTIRRISMSEAAHTRIFGRPLDLVILDEVETPVNEAAREAVARYFREPLPGPDIKWDVQQHPGGSLLVSSVAGMPVVLDPTLGPNEFEFVQSGTTK